MESKQRKAERRRGFRDKNFHLNQIMSFANCNKLAPVCSSFKIVIITYPATTDVSLLALLFAFSPSTLT